MGRASGASLAHRIRATSGSVNMPSREVPIDPVHAALLIIDVQNYCAGERAEISEYFRQSFRETVLSNIRRLQLACRRGGIEVVYSVIENMTRDGRDRSLDYKIAGIDVAHGSWEARVVERSRRVMTRWSSARPRAMCLSRPTSITYCAISGCAH